MSDWKQKKVSDAELSARTTNCLRNGGYYTMGDVALAAPWELLKIDNLGHKSLKEIELWLSAEGGVGGVQRIRLQRQLDTMRERRAILDRDIAHLEEILGQ